MPGSPAEEYLNKRGLFPANPEVAKFELGYVAEPILGHDRYVGRLAIPYLRWSQDNDYSVVNIRFRCIEDHDHKAYGHGKYESLPGSGTWLYNTAALLEDSDDAGIVEGELDAIVSTLCGLPTVGAPGAQTWAGYMARPFLGYRRVFAIGDGDDAGRQFTNMVAGTIPGCIAVEMPDKHDVNSYVLEYGVEAYSRKVGG